jgi:phospholipase C
VIPNDKVSDHPPSRVSAGQAYVTGLINAIMRGPNRKSTAIFLAWDDWGGFYDHVVPPVVDGQGYGLRVPAMLISPYARRGYIDHQTLSSTPTRSSSRTTSSADSGSTRRRTGAPTPGPECGRTRRCSATSFVNSTSTRSRGGR